MKSMEWLTENLFPILKGLFGRCTSIGLEADGHRLFIHSDFSEYILRTFREREGKEKVSKKRGKTFVIKMFIIDGSWKLYTKPRGKSAN